MSWSEFLHQLNPTGSSMIPAIWRMSDGAVLRKNIPHAAEIQDEELSGSAAFDYKLYEIVELEFEPTASCDPAGDADVQQLLDTIEQAARVSGLIYRRKLARIIVRSPYSC